MGLGTWPIFDAPPRPPVAIPAEPSRGAEGGPSSTREGRGGVGGKRSRREG